MQVKFLLKLLDNSFYLLTSVVHPLGSISSIQWCHQAIPLTTHWLLSALVCSLCCVEQLRTVGRPPSSWEVLTRLVTSLFPAEAVYQATSGHHLHFCLALPPPPLSQCNVKLQLQWREHDFLSSSCTLLSSLFPTVTTLINWNIHFLAP